MYSKWEMGFVIEGFAKLNKKNRMQQRLGVVFKRRLLGSNQQIQNSQISFYNFHGF
jgi:hypothetical protein